MKYFNCGSELIDNYNKYLPEDTQNGIDSLDHDLFGLIQEKYIWVRSIVVG